MTLIFDFDGTLVDSLNFIIRVFNHLADKFHFRKIHENDIPYIRDLNSKELIQYLQIPFYKIPKILSLARRLFRKDIKELTPFPNLNEVLFTLKQNISEFGIVTSNSKENVSAWLQHQKMDSLFNFIHVESTYFGKKKSLEKIIHAHGINKSKACYIGDETRDIEAAKQCEIYSVAVTWGFNSEKTLLSCHPDYLARQPEDLLMLSELLKL